MRSTVRRVVSRLLLVCVAAFVVALPVESAFAHGDEEGTARELVLTAIAIMQTQPGEHTAIEDKIHDATDSTETAGVDLGLVRQADRAFEAGDLQRTQVLLQQAVSACPGPPILNIPAAPRFPGGTALCPASASLRALNRSAVGGGEGVLLGIAAVVLIGLGATLAVRIR
jgi:hypothetical protein